MDKQEKVFGVLAAALGVGGNAAKTDEKGHGAYVTASDGRYEGDWKDDKWHGRGVWEFANGSKYEGEFRDGGICGRGVFVLANGNKYDGEWKDGDFPKRMQCFGME